MGIRKIWNMLTLMFSRPAGVSQRPPTPPTVKVITQITKIEYLPDGRPTRGETITGVEVLPNNNGAIIAATVAEAFGCEVPGFSERYPAGKEEVPPEKDRRRKGDSPEK